MENICFKEKFPFEYKCFSPDGSGILFLLTLRLKKYNVQQDIAPYEHLK
jgi:hypothetical protein